MGKGVHATLISRGDLGADFEWFGEKTPTTDWEADCTAEPVAFTADSAPLSVACQVRFNAGQTPLFGSG